MGGGRMAPEDWDKIANQNAKKSQQQIFSSSSMDKDFDPRNLKNGVRESVDSVGNPNSTPIILAVDVTGSMGILATHIAKNALGFLVREIYDRVPITDPHVLCAAVGDGYTDQAPLQVTQFEADVVLADQLERLWIEGNGGGNGGESYNLVWYFAANHTKTDSFTKRGKKGYIFTVGDERVHDRITPQMVKDVFGDASTVEADITTKDLYTMVAREWEVFHLVVEESSTSGYQRSLEAWRGILGERALRLTDHTKLAEVIVSTIQVNEGANATAVINSWDKTTALVVREALDSGALATVSSMQAVTRL
jgi:hypothetical protein